MFVYNRLESRAENHGQGDQWRFCLKSNNHFMKYTGSAYFIFQFHMIARLDDIFCFQRADLTPNFESPFALKSKMRWSKNILEASDAPDQAILGNTLVESHLLRGGGFCR